MEIMQLKGEDQQLYDMVAHLVMNKDVLKYNLGYPYRTSPEYSWFITVDDDSVLGFVPVKLKDGRAQINNYYIKNDDKEIFAALLENILTTLSPDFEIESIAQTRHIPVFEKNGFSVILQWKRYAKMKLCKPKKQE
jgi:hypothetical protein